MISTNLLASTLCAIKLVVGQGQWNIDQCQERAQEFMYSARKFNVDPMLLIAISVYECDLYDLRDVIYHNSQGIVARDVCPMGLRVKANLENARGGLTRQEVINRASLLLVNYKRYHQKHCKGKNHTYLQHYNTGFMKFDNDYDNNVLEIYTALRSGKSNLKIINPRTREIANNIRKATGHGDHQDYQKGCRPRSSCIIVRR